MAKTKTAFFCSECGHETSGWLGKCPGCGAWNTLVEERTVTGAQAKPSRRASWVSDGGNGRGGLAVKTEVVRLDAVLTSQDTRLSSGLSEFDRVLGGGFVRGSLVLLGGDPGIGKSTLLLQVLGLLPPEATTLYISGEESPEQIRLRADRLGTPPDRVSLLSVTDFESVAAALEKSCPHLAIVDSIQTLYVEELSAAPGSVSQVREAAAGLLRLAKGLGITIVLVGHVTKDGAIAGPRVLEHMVDTVLYFEGERHQDLRMLRAVKNRFGATDELGLFEMTDTGLKSVSNASEALLSGRPLAVPGSVITACLEGTRPLLVEVQALMNGSTYAAPLRMAQGIERNRLSMLLAVVEKHLSLGLNNLDAYLNVVGGLKISETAADLALIAAVVSSAKNKPVKNQMIILGEVGLSGEVRSVSQLDRRVVEASRLGFKHFVVPAGNRQALSKTKLPDDCELYFVDRMTEALDIIF